MNFTHFHEIFLKQVFSHCNRPIAPKYGNAEKPRVDRGFMAKQCVYCNTQCTNTFRPCGSHRMNVFPMIITVCTLMSLLQLLKRFKLHVVKQRKLPLFSWGNTNYHTGISAHVRIKHVFSMNFTHFHEIVLQHILFHCNRPNGSKYASTEKTRVDRVFMAKLCV